jgi:hypothetical protein
MEFVGITIPNPTIEKAKRQINLANATNLFDNVLVDAF